MSDVGDPPLGPHVVPPPPTEKDKKTVATAEVFVFDLSKRKPVSKPQENDLETAARKAIERKKKEEEDRRKHNAAITNGLRKK